jgi:subtilisin family serine protease
MSIIRHRRARHVIVGIAAATTFAAALAPQASAAPTTSSTQTYILLYNSGASTAGAQKAVTAAGGTVVANYSAIGVVVARSSSSRFEATIEASQRVQAAATGGLGVYGGIDEEDAAAAEDIPAPSSDSEPLTGRQWDMEQINAFAAHEITGGSPDVVVGDLDTGLDFTHPDLAPNYDAANSTDCSSGAPSPLLPGNDANGHGTHTAGTIAAAVNGIGITGVAPNVSIAGIKTSNDDGFFFPEMVVCAYMWVASHGIDVTNNSYFADPWLYNCVNDPEQRAIWEAERRAIRHAQSTGTVVVVSEGNESDDLSHPTFDKTSPDNTTPVTRAITNACSVIPVEVPGAVGVTATGDLSLKSYYSSYGISTADVAAPGGDRRFQITADSGGGRVLSTWPATVGCPAALTVVDQGAKYCYLQGTSMAGPHVAGVAALIISHTGMHGGAVAAALQQATNPLPCPDTSQPIYANFPGVNSGAPQTCTGGTAHNSFYGSGEIDALKAVS